MYYLTGEKVIVKNKFIGRVTNCTNQGIWVRPLVENKPDCSKQDAHACYSRNNVQIYKRHY